jgi:hypothetical protein
VKHCYCWVLQGEKIKSWHRTNVTRVADLLAIRIGRATSQGRPVMWSPRPELMQDRKRNGNYRHGARTKATIELWRFIKSLCWRPLMELEKSQEQPAPGVITVTEFEETQIPAGREERDES